MKHEDYDISTLLCVIESLAKKNAALSDENAKLRANTSPRHTCTIGRGLRNQRPINTSFVNELYVMSRATIVDSTPVRRVEMLDAAALTVDEILECIRDAGNLIEDSTDIGLVQWHFVTIPIQSDASLTVLDSDIFSAESFGEYLDDVMSPEPLATPTSGSFDMKVDICDEDISALIQMARDAVDDAELVHLRGVIREMMECDVPNRNPMYWLSDDDMLYRAQNPEFDHWYGENEE